MFRKLDSNLQPINLKSNVLPPDQLVSFPDFVLLGKCLWRILKCTFGATIAWEQTSDSLRSIC